EGRVLAPPREGHVLEAAAALAGPAVVEPHRRHAVQSKPARPLHEREVGALALDPERAAHEDRAPALTGGRMKDGVDLVAGEVEELCRFGRAPALVARGVQARLRRVR